MNTIEAGPELLAIGAALIETVIRTGADDADVWLSTARDASVRVRENAVDEWIDRATQRLTLRVFTGSRMATGSTTDFAASELATLAADTVALARLTSPDPAAGLPDVAATFPRPLAGLDLIDPRLVEPDPGLLRDLARRADQATRERDPRLRSGGGAVAGCSWGTVALVSSRGFAAHYAATTCQLDGNAVIDDAETKREGWWFDAGRRLADIEPPETIGLRAAEHALNQLGARKIRTREAPVVWAPQAARELLFILFEAASGDARYRGNSFMIGREGEAFASPLLSIHDDATLGGRLGSRPFDGEGVASRRTPLFERGRFGGFLHDTYSARRASVESTGNAGRAGIRGAAIAVEASNLVMSPGTTPPGEIIAGVDEGLYLTGMLGFGENLTTGDFSRGASGFWIERGELAWPVTGVNISGRLPEMLAGIDAVGNDAFFVGQASAPTFRIDRMMISGD